MRVIIVLVTIYCAFICTTAHSQTTSNNNVQKSITSQLSDHVEGLDIWGFAWMVDGDGDIEVPKIRLRTTYTRGSFNSFLDLDLAQLEEPSGDWVQEVSVGMKFEKWDLKFGRIFTGDYTLPPFLLPTVGYHSSAAGGLGFFSWGTQAGYRFNERWSLKTTVGGRGGPVFDDKRAFGGYGVTSYLKGNWTNGNLLVGAQASDEKWAVFTNGTLTPGDWFLRGGLFYGSERKNKLRGYILVERSLFNDLLHPYVRLEHAGEFIPTTGLGVGDPASPLYFVVDRNHDEGVWNARLQVRF